MEEIMIAIRDSKTFYFDFDWPKDIDENLKHEMELFIKSNRFLDSSTQKIAKRMTHINLFFTFHKVKI